MSRCTVYLLEGRDKNLRPMYWTGLIERGYRADFNYDPWCAAHFHEHDYASAVWSNYPELKDFLIVAHVFDAGREEHLTEFYKRKAAEAELLKRDAISRAERAEATWAERDAALRALSAKWEWRRIKARRAEEIEQITRKLMEQP